MLIEKRCFRIFLICLINKSAKSAVSWGERCALCVFTDKAVDKELRSWLLHKILFWMRDVLILWEKAAFWYFGGTSVSALRFRVWSEENRKKVNLRGVDKFEYCHKNKIFKKVIYEITFSFNLLMMKWKCLWGIPKKIGKTGNAARRARTEDRV